MTSVAFLVDQLFYRVPGGIGSYIQNLVPALEEADPSLELSLFHARFGRPPPVELAGRRRVEMSRGIRALYPAWNSVGRPGLPPELAGCDLVHAPSPAAVPPVRSGQQLVVTVHDLAFRLYPAAFPTVWRTLYRAGLRRAVRRAGALLTVSRHTARDLVRLTRVDPSRIHITPLAASLPVGSHDPAPALDRLKVPRPYLLFVGTLEPRKNLVRLIRAYRQVAVTLPHALVLAGPLGWRSQAVHRELAISGPGRILLTGRVPGADLDALYRGADALCYPSLYEGFGLPVLEAMTRGVPTVISTSSSLSEVAGDAALAVHPRSVRELAAALERVMTDRAEAERLSAAGLERASLFSWDQTARLTLKAYEAAG